MPALAAVSFVPDLAREAMYELIDGGEFAGRTVSAYYQLQLDYTTVARNGAAVLIYTTGGTEGVDRADRTTVEVYAPGTTALRVAEAIRDHVAGNPMIWGGDGLPHDLAAGYVDGIRCDVTPHDVPYQSEATNLARAVYIVTHRPQ